MLNQQMLRGRKLPVALRLPWRFKIKETSRFFPSATFNRPTDGTQNAIKLTAGFPATRPLHVELHDTASHPRLDTESMAERAEGKASREGERL